MKAPEYQRFVIFLDSVYDSSEILQQIASLRQTACKRSMGTQCFFLFSKENNFLDFLFVSLQDKALPEGVFS